MNPNSELPLRCACGQMRGVARGDSTPAAMRLVCYCDDCQRYAHALGRAERLDAQGGSETVQLMTDQIELLAGAEHLACMRLSRKGLHRWYAGCCRTPLANTLPQTWAPFATLSAAFVDSAVDLDDVLGPIRFRLNVRFAKEPRPQGAQGFPLGWVARTLPHLLFATLQGRSQPSAFLDSAGRLRVQPQVVSALSPTA